ncbi:hypothetical protein BDR03DRAFT_973100 [Suillus americanus]|nr:hypothetical protein BDR03DRAFT_973100 [Suillus americanus]
MSRTLSTPPPSHPLIPQYHCQFLRHVKPRSVKAAVFSPPTTIASISACFWSGNEDNVTPTLLFLHWRG